MGKLALLGAILLSGHGHLQHHQQYWWPAQNQCTITTGTDRHGVWHATPFIQCRTIPAHYSNTPPPAEAGVPVNSPAATQSAQNYCPLKPDCYCTPPANPINIGSGYQGN